MVLGLIAPKTSWSKVKGILIFAIIDYINKEQQGSVLDIFHLNNLTVDDNINDLVGCAKDTPGLDSRDSTRGSK